MQDNGFDPMSGSFDPQMMQDGSGGFPDPLGDIFLAGGQETPRGLIREMLSAGDDEDDMLVRLRLEPKDISDFADMDYEESFIENRGKPDDAGLRKREQLMGVGLYGEARHEVLQMYTRIMASFQGPGKWQAAANRALRRAPSSSQE